jgi:hypothetical protein
VEQNCAIEKLLLRTTSSDMSLRRDGLLETVSPRRIAQFKKPSSHQLHQLKTKLKPFQTDRQPSTISTSTYSRLIYRIANVISQECSTYWIFQSGPYHQ